MEFQITEHPSILEHSPITSSWLGLRLISSNSPIHRRQSSVFQLPPTLSNLSFPLMRFVVDERLNFDYRAGEEFDSTPLMPRYNFTSATSPRNIITTSRRHRVTLRFIDTITGVVLAQTAFEVHCLTNIVVAST